MRSDRLFHIDLNSDIDHEIPDGSIVAFWTLNIKFVVINQDLLGSYNF